MIGTAESAGAPMQAPEECCLRCKHYRGDEEGGDCHAGPPTLVTMVMGSAVKGAPPQLQFGSRFPPTSALELCGAFTPRPARKQLGDAPLFFDESALRALATARAPSEPVAQPTQEKTDAAS